MRERTIHPTRHRRPFVAPLLLFAGYLAGEAILVAVGHPAPCLFRLLTGLPCPTCGTTRAVLCLLHLDVPGALAYNPLVTLALLALPVAAALSRVPRGRVWLGGFTRRPARHALLLGALLLLNWGYVLHAERRRADSGRNAGPPAGIASLKHLLGRSGR